MSYVRFSTKVVTPCPECGDRDWVALLPEHPTWLTWRPNVPEGVKPWDDGYPRMPACCTSCWYIYHDVGGWLQVYHAGPHVCQGPNGEEFDSVRFVDVEEARGWEPPEWCRHRDMALECVRDWIADETEEA